MAVVPMPCYPRSITHKFLKADRPDRSSSTNQTYLQVTIFVLFHDVGTGFFFLFRSSVRVENFFD